MSAARKNKPVRVVNFGSLNVDHVYQLPWFVRPGETLSGRSYRRFAGGKGLNQSVALARAGIAVLHAGRIGADGGFLVETLSEAGADTRLVAVADEPTGHAIIQVITSGENAIILFGGANRGIGKGDAERVCATLGIGDILLLQNEISSMPDIMERAAAAGARIVFNPAPMGPEVARYPLDLVSLFILNEIEAAGLAAGDSDCAADAAEPERIALTLVSRYPHAGVCLTLGKRGAVFAQGDLLVRQPAFPVNAVDTTAAGDTFTGYFTAGLAEGMDVRENLRRACAAAAICVTRAGASVSIPGLAEVEAFLSAGG